MTVNETLRLLAPEFKEESEDNIDLWVSLAKPFVSKKQFGKLYPHALAYMAAHMMKLSGLGDNTYGTIADAMRLASVSEGNTSISFNTGAYTSDTVDAELGLTPYGIGFRRIRRSCIVPITIAGVERG